MKKGDLFEIIDLSRVKPNRNPPFLTLIKAAVYVSYLLRPYLPAGRCRGDTRVFPEWLRVITGRLSKEEEGRVTLGLHYYWGL